METRKQSKLLLLGQPAELPQFQLPTKSDIIRLCFLRINEFKSLHEVKKLKADDRKNIIACPLTSDSLLKCVGKY